MHESAVVPGLGQVPVELDGLRIVIDGMGIVLALGKKVSTIIIEVGILRRQFDGLAQVAQHIGRLQFDVGALRSVEFVDTRLADGPQPIGQCRMAGIHLDKRR